MSFNTRDPTYYTNGEICDLVNDPVYLKQEHVEALDQQHIQNGFQNGISPFSGISNGTPSGLHNGLQPGINGEGISPNYIAPNYYVDPWAANASANTNTSIIPAPPSDDMQYAAAPVMFENGLASTVSLPSFGGPAVLTPAPKASPDDAKKKKRRPLLSAVEEALLQTDDAELTEEQLVTKKKAQNRLAQRAFRERKEGKLKELETKLLQSEEERQKLLEKFFEIKGQYILMQNENRILRSGADVLANYSAPGNLEASGFVFPQTQKEFIDEMVEGKHEVQEAYINKVYDEPQHPGKKVLGVGAVWDYLQIKAEEEEYENVDLMEVMALLKGNEKCHGYGPAYSLDLVEAALKKVAEES